MKRFWKRLYLAMQVILWAALAVVFFCMLFLDGRWQGSVFAAITMALICLYSYKKHLASEKNLEGYFMACVAIYVGLVIVYLISSSR